LSPAIIPQTPRTAKAPPNQKKVFFHQAGLEAFFFATAIQDTWCSSADIDHLTLWLQHFQEFLGCLALSFKRFLEHAHLVDALCGFAFGGSLGLVRSLDSVCRRTDPHMSVIGVLTGSIRGSGVESEASEGL